VLGSESIDVGGAVSRCGGDGDLAVVDGQGGLGDVDVDYLVGVHGADADLLPGDLNGALDAHDAIDDRTVGVAC